MTIKSGLSDLCVAFAQSASGTVNNNAHVVAKPTYDAPGLN